RSIWLLKAICCVVRLAVRGKRFDVIVSSSGPILVHAVASVAKISWPGACWMADYRDLWSTGSYYRAQPFFGPGLHLRRFIERSMLRLADLISTVSKGLQVNLASFHDREVLLFHNGFEPVTSPAGGISRDD